MEAARVLAGRYTTAWRMHTRTIMHCTAPFHDRLTGRRSNVKDSIMKKET